MECGENFVLMREKNIEMERNEYPKLTNFSQSGTMYSINKDGTLGEKIGTYDMLKEK